MLSFLKRLLGLQPREAAEGVVVNADGSVTFHPPGMAPKPDRLAPLATDSARREEFIKVLAADGVFILTSVPQKRSNEVKFLDYVEQGVPVFPLFSSEEQASRYIQALPDSDITPYECLGLKGTWLLENQWGTTRLLLNPRSDAETVITAEDLQRLRSVCVG
jgi:hypothetical protein